MRPAIQSNSVLFPYDRWRRDLATLARGYRSNEPFPHLHLRRFLEPEAAARVAGEFPRAGDTRWIEYRHFNERKLGKSRRSEFPRLLGELVDELNSARFTRWLSDLTGIEGLLADPDLEGGGLHQTERGGFLNVHADFTHHHRRPGWRRRINLILYLNEPWPADWGGALELWDREMAQVVAKVPPRLNHAVIFSTNETSYHGYPEPLTCPESERRKSLALYYYTDEPEDRYRARSTDYRARPQDRGLKRPLIWLDKKAVAVYSATKKHLGLSDELTGRILGLFRRDDRK